MKLPHYVGGLEGLTEPLNFEKRVFVADWETRIFGISVAMMGLSRQLGSALPRYPIEQVPTAFHDEWTWADLRTGAEAMNPFDYFKLRYYERWLGGITQYLIDKGYFSADELATRTKELPPPRLARRRPSTTRSSRTCATVTACAAMARTRSSPSATRCGSQTCRPGRTPGCPGI
jgi:hypothetical protein